MSSLRGDVVMTVYPSGFQRFGVCLRVAAKASTATGSAGIGVNLAAAIADEDEFDLLLEGGHIGDVRRRNAAPAKDADVGERVEIGQRDLPGLHAAHGQTRHRAMGLVGESAIVAVYVGDQVINEDPFEGAEVEGSAKSATPACASSGGPARRASRAPTSRSRTTRSRPADRHRRACHPRSPSR